jgi:hypothetical protein
MASGALLVWSGSGSEQTESMLLVPLHNSAAQHALPGCGGFGYLGKAILALELQMLED